MDREGFKQGDRCSKDDKQSTGQSHGQSTGIRMTINEKVISTRLNTNYESMSKTTSSSSLKTR